MFGLVCPGHPCFTDFRQVERNKWAFQLNNRNRIKEMMVFFQPNCCRLSENMGVAIYLADKSRIFEYVDYINGMKQSVLVRVPDTFVNDHGNIVMSTIFGRSTQEIKRDVLFVGLQTLTKEEIENLESGNNQKKNDFSHQVSELATYIVENVSNYISSFSKFVPPANRDLIVMPQEAMNGWMNKFRNKFRRDPYFWKGEAGKVNM